MNKHLSLSSALRRKKDVADQFHIIDDASEMSSVLSSTSKRAEAKEPVATEDEETKPKASFSKRIAAFGKMYSGSRASKQSTSSISVRQSAGSPTASPSNGKPLRRARDLIGRSGRQDDEDLPTTPSREKMKKGNKEVPRQEKIEPLDTGFAEDYESDGTCHESTQRRSPRPMMDQQTQKPSRIAHPSLKDVTSGLQEQKLDKRRSDSSPKVRVRGRRHEILSPRNKKAPIDKEKVENLNSVDKAFETSNDDSKMDQYFSKQPSPRNLSCGVSVVSRTRPVANSPQSIRGTNSTLSLSLGPKASIGEARSVHRDMLQSPRSPKTPNSQHKKRTVKSNRGESLALPELPVPKTPTLDTRVSTPMDTPEKTPRMSRCTIAEGDNVDAPKFIRSTSRSAQRDGEPSTPGKQRRAASHSPHTPRTPPLATLSDLSLRGKLVRRTNSGSSGRSRSRDPSVERIFKMLEQVSPNKTEDDEDQDHSPSKPSTRKRRIKLSSNLLLGDDEDVDRNEFINAVKEQQKAGRVELLKKEMVDEVLAARKASKSPNRKKKCVASVFGSELSPPKSPSSKPPVKRSLDSLVGLLAIDSPERSPTNRHATGSRSVSGRDLVKERDAASSRFKAKGVVSGSRSVAHHESGGDLSAPSRKSSPRRVSEESSSPMKTVRRANSCRNVSVDTSDTPKCVSKRGIHCRGSHSLRSNSASEHDRKARSPRKLSSSSSVAGHDTSRESSPDTGLKRSLHVSKSPRKASGGSASVSGHEVFHYPPDMALNKSLHASSAKSGQSAHGERSTHVLRKHTGDEAGVHRGADPSLSRKSDRRRRDACEEVDEEPIVLKPVEGRKAMRMLNSTSRSDHNHVFAQLQIPGLDSCEQKMTVQYEDC